MVGFVRFPRSPRHVELDPGQALSRQVRGRAARVLLVVDADDAALDEAVAALDPEFIQLHGRESPERAAAIRQRYGRTVMKALGVSTRADLAALSAYAEAVDRILLDAKPPKGAVLPGGNGIAFDWTLLAGDPAAGPDPLAGLDPGRLMLSGGLTPDSVGAAIRMTGLTAVDVSSGVETGPGTKDPDRIRAFVAAARQAFGTDDPARTRT
jgi:phosphoribosylanthranilate isomerase